MDREVRCKYFLGSSSVPLYMLYFFSFLLLLHVYLCCIGFGVLYCNNKDKNWEDFLCVDMTLKRFCAHNISASDHDQVGINSPRITYTRFAHCL